MKKDKIKQYSNNLCFNCNFEKLFFTLYFHNKTDIIMNIH